MNRVCLLTMFIKCTKFDEHTCKGFSLKFAKKVEIETHTYIHTHTHAQQR